MKLLITVASALALSSAFAVDARPVNVAVSSREAKPDTGREHWFAGKPDPEDIGREHWKRTADTDREHWLVGKPKPTTDDTAREHWKRTADTDREH
ncbi:hypothetical protein HDU86_001146, partial [Geranomyces michiganensis]